MTAQQWTCTREQLTDAIAGIKATVPTSGPAAGMVLADSMADAILAQLPAVRAETDWAVAYGGDDPNECAGILTYDDQADAEEHVQWTTAGFVASRLALYGPWVRAEVPS